MTTDERDAIRERARAEDTSVSGLLAALATVPAGACTHRPRRAPGGADGIEAELAVIRRQLSGATTNLNQAVRWMHVHDTAPPGIEALAAELSGLATRVSAELTRLAQA